jgi:putative tricarboxylic transport membrane protein
MAFRKEIVGSLVFILFGVGFLLYGLNYPLDQWANPGPGVFPLIVGVTLVILAAWQLLHSFWKLKPSAGREKGGEAVTSAREYLHRNKGETKALLMIAVFVIYLLMVQWVGFFVSNSLFVVISSRLMKEKGWRGPIALSAGINLFCYVMFEIWLKLSFPRGILF